MRSALVTLATLLVLAGCGGGIPTDKGQAPHHVYGHHRAVIKLINHRYATCLKALKAHRVKWTTGDLYQALTPEGGSFNWSVWTDGTGSIDTRGGAGGVSAAVLRSAGCKTDGMPITH